MFIASYKLPNSTANNTSTITCDVPTTGTGGAVAAGDFAIVGISGSTNTTFTTPPSGWSQPSISPDTSSNGGAAIYYKFLVGGDIGSTFTWAGGSAQRRSTACLVFRNVDTTTPIAPETPAMATYSTTTSTRANPSITLTAVRDLVSFIFDRQATTLWTPSGAWTAEADSYNTGSGGAAIAAAYRTNVSAGATGGDNWTRTGGTATGALTSIVALNLISATTNTTNFFAFI